MAKDGISAAARYRLAVEEHTQRLIDDGKVARWDGEGEEYFHRPGELVVSLERLDLITGELANLGGEPQVHEDLGTATLTVPADVPIHTVVADLRAKHQLSAADLSPHHVMFGAPKRAGCPGRPAHPGPPIELPVDEGGPGSGVLIAVIDTGLADQATEVPWVRRQVETGAGGADVDVLDADSDSFLDFEAGHGTFIAGLIAQTAPGARVQAIRALDPDGLTDDVTAARAVLRAVEMGAYIINLSFGGYSFADDGPLALQRVLANQKAVVVAAAGNDGIDRPFYPAALPGVIAVGALGASGKRASWSNFGDWVTACAHGDRLLSIFVTGVERTPTSSALPTEFSAPYAYWSGTSFAAPQVAAALAVRMSEANESALDAAQALILDAGLPRRSGLGVRVSTAVRSNPASVENT